MSSKDPEKRREANKRYYEKKKAADSLCSATWMFIFYPESAPENWEEIIRSWQVETIVSPLHDKDIQPDGSLKKPHWHGVLCFESKKSLEQVIEFIKELNGPAPQRARGSRRNCLLYLIHANDPDKFQYSSNDIQEFGGASFKRETERPEDDFLKYNAEMIRFCMEKNIMSFATLVLYAMEFRQDWFETLSRRSSYFLKEFLKTRYKEMMSPSGAYGATLDELRRMEKGSE